MVLDEAKIPAWPIRGDGFAHGDLEMGLALIAGPDISAVYADGNRPLRIGELLALMGPGLHETPSLISQFSFHPGRHTAQMSANRVRTEARIDRSYSEIWVMA